MQLKYMNKRQEKTDQKIFANLTLHLQITQILFIKALLQKYTYEISMNFHLVILQSTEWAVSQQLRGHKETELKECKEMLNDNKVFLG